jgi:hypothetical protein
VHVRRRRASVATTSSTNSIAASIAGYVPGDMPLDEQTEFEVRMAEDQELAQAVLAASATDYLLPRAAEEDRRGRP